MGLRSIKYYLVIILFLSGFGEIYSQKNTDSLIASNRRLLRTKNSEGTEFWLCFQRNYKDSKTPTPQTELHLEFFITGDEDAKVRIIIEGIGYDYSFDLKGGSVQNIKIPVEAQVKSDEVKEKLGINIKSDKPIAVYGLNRRFQTTDTYLGLPTSVLGTEYRVMGYTVSEGLMSHFAVVATENGTEVTITPSTNTATHPGGIAYPIVLNKGEVYQVAARNDRMGSCDITGSLIKSNKKIAVFSGHQCAYVPPTIMACNHLVEQIPPIPSWGKHYYLGMLKPRSNYTFRVLANEPQTRVFLDAKLIKTLNGGEYWDSTVKKNIQITANKPILVAQYSQGFKNGDSLGDPMMLLISPTQQFLRQYRFATPINGSWKHNINVVVPNQGIPSMRLDGQAIEPKQFTQLGISRYSIAFINVPYGSHLIEGALPFGMYSYGFGFGNDAYDAYGTMAGQSFIEYEPAADTLPPLADSKVTDGKYNIVFRDDRVDDTGIREINVVDNLGFDFKAPKLDEGTPQLQIPIKPLDASTPGRLVLRVKDIALNEVTFTICYYFDGKTGKFMYSLNEGVVTNCMPDPGIQIGAFVKLNTNIHSANFVNSGKVTANGAFGDATAFGGFGGLFIGRRFSNDWLLSARISLENSPGIIEAADSVPSKIRAENGKLIDFQESRLLELKGLTLNFGFAAEYYFESLVYALGGLNIGISLSDAIEYKNKILIPDYSTYPDGSRETNSPNGVRNATNIGSLNSIRLSAFAGLGISIPINYYLTAFSEFTYTFPLSSMINDGTWKIHLLSIQIGARYRI